MNSKQRVIITGSSGFIGSALYKYLKKNNIPCHGISRSNSEFTDTIVNNYQKVISMNDGNSLLINLAGSNTLVSDEEVDLIRLLSKSYKDKMIFISSAQVYGSRFIKPISEIQDISTIKNYAKSKIFLETETINNNGMVLRLSNIYGKGMSEKNIFNKIYSQILQNQNNILIQNITAIRDYLYIDDLCEIFMKIILGKVQNKIFNVGTEIGTDVLTLVKHIADHLNYTNNKVNIISEENYQDSIILDTSLLRRSYDWTPKVIIKEGIQKWLN